MTLLAVGALLAIAWIPGAVLFRAPFLDRARRAALSAEERTFWAVILSVTISLCITMGLAAAGRYSFERLLTANALLTFGVAVVSRFRLRLGAGPPPPSAAILLPIALVALAVWRFFPPAEYIMGGKDPGIYMNEGIQIAQRGGLMITDQAVASVPPQTRDLFFPSHRNPHYYSLRFMGFFIQDPDRGLVVGQFPHLYPASIALGYGVDGLTGARRATGFWATLGLLAVYFAGVRLFGRTAAAAAATLLAFHVLQVWYARYPNAEIMMQPLLISALLATDRGLQDRDRFFAPLAGVLLGLQVCLRVDIALAIAAVAVSAALGIARRRPIPWALVGPLAAFSGAGVWYLVTMLPAYAYYPVGFTRDWILPPAIAIGMAGVASLFWIRRRPSWVTTLERFLPPSLVALALAAVTYAWFFRHATGRTAPHDAEALRTFTQAYFAPAGLLAALAGYTYVVLRRFWHAPATLLSITAFCCFFFYKIRIVPEHFWMGRRLIALILPGLLLLAAGFAVSSLWDGTRGRRRVLTAALGLVFLALLGTYYARVARPVLTHVEYAGIIPRLEALSARFGDDDLVIVESRDASDIHVLGLPLAYIYARNVLLLATPVPDKATLASFLEWAHTRYSRVFFLGSGGTDLLSRRWSVQSVVSEQFRVPEYETTPWQGFPRTVRQKEFDYGIYRFGPPRPDTAAIMDLDVGIADDLHVVRFHAKEQTEGRWMRWSGRTSWISVMPARAARRIVTIWMSDGGRPADVDPARVSVHLNDQLLGTVTVGTGFRPYTFAIPPDLAASAAAADPPRLKLVTNLWNPHDALGSRDDRNLGVMVDRVQVQ